MYEEGHDTHQGPGKLAGTGDQGPLEVTRLEDLPEVDTEKTEYQVCENTCVAHKFTEIDQEIRTHTSFPRNLYRCSPLYHLASSCTNERRRAAGVRSNEN